MSQLIDKLKRVNQNAPRAVGFRVGQPASPKPKMLLIASLTQAKIDNLTDYVGGADGGLLTVPRTSQIQALKEASQAMPDIPWGTWLIDGGQAKIDETVEALCDFVVFASSTPLAIAQNDAVGKVLEVEVSLSDGLLRATDDMPVDALLIAGEQEEDNPLTWHHLMLFQRFAILLTKPFLVRVPSNVTADELQALWEAGVSGIIVKAETEQPPGRIGELRQIIDNLTYPSRRKQRKAEPLLPHIGQQVETVPEEEEE